MRSFPIWRQSKDPTLAGFTGTNPSNELRDSMEIRRDVPIPVRDGTDILTDIFQPPSGSNFPVIVAWGPYGKHSSLRCKDIPGSGVDPEWVSDYASFEGPDPAYWVRHGYAVVHVDPRGTWGTEGDCYFHDDNEARDCYDVIEWLGTQPWSNGRVGLAGVSYLAIIQWRVAALRPPHLAAINPWEGFTDLYRDYSFHGGIPETAFSTLWLNTRVGFGGGRVEDIAAEAEAHPLVDEYWQQKAIDLTAIDVPAYVVAGWGDHGLHTRGTIDGFRQIGSAQKWLEVHGQQKWGYYYHPQSVERQRRFFDHFLLDEKNDVPAWPSVQLEIRIDSSTSDHVTKEEWPPRDTHEVALFLDANKASLSRDPSADESSVQYAAIDGAGAAFDFIFDERCDLVGAMELRLWFECIGFDDGDVFVAIEKINAHGERVHFPFYTTQYDGDVALGWLRVSHREAARPDGTMPPTRHENERKLKPNEVVEIAVEIWPSATRFESEDTLRLRVMGRDTFTYDESVRVMGHSSFKEGEHVIHTGGKFRSRLTVSTIDG